MSEITFKTNLKTNDYEMEFGAHRCFDALRLAMLQEDDEIEREKEEEKLNPMKLLENRTKQSKEEMEEIEKLTRLKEENASKQGVDVDELIESRIAREKDEKKLLEERLKAEEAEDEQMAKELMQLAQSRQVEEDAGRSTDSKLISTNFFAKAARPASTLTGESSDAGVKKRKLEGLVAVKKKEPPKTKSVVEAEQPRLASLMSGYSSDSGSE